ncbi:hypothetical protein IV503_30535 [Klebsiella huaxiensis]|uniref:fimbrial protein n=1 Tax=Klebsiella huaxiensis TaxID=2153354 RepID=UPI002F2D397E
MNVQKIFILFLFTFLSALSLEGIAAVTCTPYMSRVINDQLPLSAAITVGDDIPVGTSIYDISISTRYTLGVSCNGPYSLYGLMEYGSTPMPLSPWSGNGLGGKVYQTNVPGVGALLGKGSSPATPVLSNILPYQYTNYVNYNASGGTTAATNTVVLSLIKIGPISGGVINSALLPTMKYTVQPASGYYNGIPLQLWTVRYTGALTIVAGTCNISNVTVDMGKYHVADFSRVGSTSNWKDASIVLTNCPRFYGYNPYTNSVIISNNGYRRENTVANTLQVYLQPTSSETQNVTQGILNVSAPGGKTAATGFGIQLGWGNYAGSPSIVNFNNPFVYKLGIDTNSSTIKIPLAARYIRTQSQVQPGIANSRVTFVVQYK